MNVEFLLLCFLLNGVDDASVLDLNAYASTTMRSPSFRPLVTT